MFLHGSSFVLCFSMTCVQYIISVRNHVLSVKTRNVDQYESDQNDPVRKQSQTVNTLMSEEFGSNIFIVIMR